MSTKTTPRIDQAAGSRRHTLHIVGCSAAKNPLLRSRRLPARSAYCGAAFLAAREYLEALRLPWVILSAKYGILWPGDEIEWYDDRLTKAPWEGEWCGSLDSMSQKQYGRLMSFSRYVVLAGSIYAEHAREILDRPIEQPLVGMGIGSQIRALKLGTWTANPH